MAKDILSTFNLKEPNSITETPIYFSAYRKNERRKFVYSTKERIHPSEWDFKYRIPNNTIGRSDISRKHREIEMQIKRYSSFYIELVNRYKSINEELSIEILKDEFDLKFKKERNKSLDFFGVYDLFIQEKRRDKTTEANATSTIKRYEYFKSILKEYEESYNTRLHLNRINNSFYNSFLEFCIEEKVHYNNTLRRNIGLLKSYLNWALKNRYTFNSKFQSFKTPEGYLTDEIALTMEEVKEIYLFDFSDNKRLEKVRDLFVFGCTTGMRFSNYSIVKHRDIQEDYIYTIDGKDKSKILNIPLSTISTTILKKYDYKLPKISSTNFNKYIKQVVKEVGYVKLTKKISHIGNKVEESFIPMYNRVSSHTARRSFITIMKNNLVPDKVIMNITGHKSVEVFNRYYKPSDNEKKKFIDTVWNIDFESQPIKPNKND